MCCKVGGGGRACERSSGGIAPATSSNLSEVSCAPAHWWHKHCSRAQPRPARQQLQRNAHLRCWRQTSTKGLHQLHRAAHVQLELPADCRLLTREHCMAAEHALTCCILRLCRHTFEAGHRPGEGVGQDGGGQSRRSARAALLGCCRWLEACQGPLHPAVRHSLDAAACVHNWRLAAAESTLLLPRA